MKYKKKPVVIEAIIWNGNNLEEVVLRRFKEIDVLKAQSKKNKDSIDAINEEMLKVYKKVGIVKYDAFNEMGGKLSFALAMLDKSNNGYLINAMHSREGCYTYIKEIVKGESYITLCDEEKKALTVETLLEKFSQSSGQEFANDRALLS
jgi:hypothetical protein